MWNSLYVTVDIRLTTTQAIRIRILLLSNTMSAENLPSPFARLVLSTSANLSLTSTKENNQIHTHIYIYIYIYKAFIVLSFHVLISNPFKIDPSQLNSKRWATVLRLLIVARRCLRMLMYTDIFNPVQYINVNRENEVEDGDRGVRGVLVIRPRAFFPVRSSLRLVQLAAATLRQTHYNWKSVKMVTLLRL